MKLSPKQTLQSQTAYKNPYPVQSYRLGGNAEIPREYSSPKRIIRQKSKMVIAFIVMSLIVLFWSRAVSAQYKKDFLFENPDTKERIKIETGNKVAIRFKIPDVMITGIILLLSDSSMNLVVDQVQQLVSFRNIASMKVIAQAKERYVVRLT